MVFTWLSDAITIVCASTGSITNGYNYVSLESKKRWIIVIRGYIHYWHYYPDAGGAWQYWNPAEVNTRRVISCSPGPWALSSWLIFWIPGTHLMTTNISSLASLIWSVADLLRGDFKQSQYGRIILPFTVLRRLECVLAPTKAQVPKNSGHGTKWVNSHPEVTNDKTSIKSQWHQKRCGFEESIWPLFRWPNSVNHYNNSGAMFIVSERTGQYCKS